MQESNPEFSRQKITAAAVFFILIAALALLSALLTGEDRSTVEKQSFYTVRKTDLDIAVVEPGTIKHREKIIIKNELEGNTTILYLIDEGVKAQKGELLIELDSSKLEEKLASQQIKVKNAEAAYIRAREELEITKNQVKSDIDNAELESRFALEDAEQYEAGEYPKQLNELEGKIALSREELQRAVEKRAWSRVLFNEKYISQTELQADELAAKKAEMDLDLAISDLELLKDFTYKRRVAELESKVRMTAVTLDRMKRRAAASLLQAEAELRAREAEFNSEKEKFAKIENQITKTKIASPIDGLVVYATTLQMNWRGNKEPLSVGQGVKEREELIHLPVPGAFIAEVKIHEANLDKVAVDQPVRFQVDALPGRTYTGRVAAIAPLPDPTSFWINADLKVYKTEIAIEGNISGLRTGMSCQAEILVQELHDVMSVPVQCIQLRDGKSYVWLAGRNRPQQHPVQTGQDNNQLVHIVSGLQPGDQVLLSPPLHVSSKKAGQDTAINELSHQQPEKPSPPVNRPESRIK